MAQIRKMTLEFSGGTTINKAVEISLDMARRNHCEVKLIFNDIIVPIELRYQNYSPDFFINCYYLKFKNSARQLSGFKCYNKYKEVVMGKGFWFFNEFTGKREYITEKEVRELEIEAEERERLDREEKKLKAAERKRQRDIIRRIIGG